MKLSEIKTYENVRDLYASKGYKFRQENMALNLGAIRSKTSLSDKFDDLGWCAFRDENGVAQVHFYWLTTDPGKHWLQNPMKADGTIILVPGQYKEVYSKGLHNNSYDCFKQTGQMYYVRDYNKDLILDFDLYRNPEQLKIRGFWGVNGTNLHRAHQNLILDYINKYSAGCMVVRNPNTFKKLLEFRDKSINFGFTKFDWTLFEEE